MNWQLLNQIATATARVVHRSGYPSIKSGEDISQISVGFRESDYYNTDTNTLIKISLY